MSGCNMKIQGLKFHLLASFIVMGSLFSSPAMGALELITYQGRVTDGSGVPLGDGTYNVVVKASDGELESSEQLTLTVEDKNVAPVIDNVEDVVIDEGETVRIQPRVTDVDGDKTSVTITDPVGNDGFWETGYTDHGTYSVTISASDGKGTSTKNVKISIRDINRPPQIVDITLQ